MLKIKKECNILWVRFGNDIDKDAEEMLKQVLCQELDTVKELWFDMVGVTEMSGILLQLMLQAQAEMDKRGQMFIFRVNKKLRGRLQTTGLL